MQTRHVEPLRYPTDEWTDNRPTLLIADDDETVRSMLTMQLGSEFNVVASAADAGTAVALAGELKPDAALIDVQMPGGGARVVVPGIARCSPHTCMVILSGDESHAVVLELLGFGAAAYLRKGITGAQIATTLGLALRSVHPSAVAVEA